MTSSPVLLPLSPISPVLLLCGSPVSVVVIPELVGSSLSAELVLLLVVIVVLAPASPVSSLVADPTESLAQLTTARSTSPAGNDRVLVDIAKLRVGTSKPSEEIPRERRREVGGAMGTVELAPHDWSVRVAALIDEAWAVGDRLAAATVSRQELVARLLPGAQWHDVVVD